MAADEHYVIRANVEGNVGFYLGGRNWRSGWTPDLRKAAMYSFEEAYELASSKPMDGDPVSTERCDYGVVHVGSGRLLRSEPPSEWCGCYGIPRSPRALWHWLAGKPCSRLLEARPESPAGRALTVGPGAGQSASEMR